MKKLKFTLNNNFVNVDSYQNTYFLPYPCEDHTTCYPYVSLLPPGVYNLEVWGAQGGSYNEVNVGGKGGYSRGLLKLNSQTRAYFYVGASGQATTEKLVNSSLSFNGGGNGRSSAQDHASSGGGASDIRLVGDSLYHRVIVAGGGGGAGEYGSSCFGGAGGGKEGTDGMACYPKAVKGTKGTQTEAGITKSSGINGTFGYGGNKTTWDGCGGGGGWFGGGSGSGWISTGGGGSGFVFDADSLANARSQGLLLKNRFLLRDAATFDGSKEFPAFKSFLNETGHESNGAISITLLQLSLCTVRQISFSRRYSMLFLIISLKS